MDAHIKVEDFEPLAVYPSKLLEDCGNFINEELDTTSKIYFTTITAKTFETTTAKTCLYFRDYVYWKKWKYILEREWALIISLFAENIEIFVWFILWLQGNSSYNFEA